MGRCSRWRSVACRTPKLWNCIWLNWPVRFIKLALKRSSKCELHIGLDYESTSQLSYLYDRLGPLKGEAERVTNLDIITGLGNTGGRRNLCFRLFPKLAQITLRGSISSSERYFMVFSRCRHLVLYETLLSPIRRCSFPNIRKLEILGIDWTMDVHKGMGRMLECMPLLKTLILHVSSCERQFIDDCMPVTVPSCVDTFQIQCLALYPLSCLSFDNLLYPSNTLLKWIGSDLTGTHSSTLEENDQGPVERSLKLLSPALGCLIIFTFDKRP